MGLVVATAPRPADARELLGRCRVQMDEDPAQVADGMAPGHRLPRVEHFGQAARHQRVDAEPVARGQLGLLEIRGGAVGALHEAGPAGVGLGLVQDAGDAGVAAVVQADAAHAEAIVAEPAPAGPRGQLRDRAAGLRRVPRRADRQRAAEPQLPPRVALPVGGQHLGRDPVALVDRGDPAGRVVALRDAERAQAVGGREARRLAHQGELEHLDQVVLDEEAGGLAGRVLRDLHARRRRPCRG